MAESSARIHIGTASWSDPGFVEFWYPKRLPAGGRLRWYAQHFELVEVNSSFYSVPSAAMAKRWCEATPDDFIFDIKLHQLFSRHSTSGKLLPPELRRRFRLANQDKVFPTQELEHALMLAFAPALEILGHAGKLGVLLLQLSPAFSPGRHQLSELDTILMLFEQFSVAVELRNRHWAEDSQREETTRYLREHGAIYVNVDAPAEKHFTIMPSELNVITSPEITYLRLHGRDSAAYLKGKTVATRFHYDYSEEEIQEIAVRAEALARHAREVHIIFNNNSRDYAPHAAMRLRRALGQLIKFPPRTLELF